MIGGDPLGFVKKTDLELSLGIAAAKKNLRPAAGNL